MQQWLLPTLGTIFFWGIWGFLPKIVVKHISPNSAIVYETFSSFLVSFIVFLSLGYNFQNDYKGVFFAVLTGLFGAAGAFCFLKAVSCGSVMIIAPLSALYPIVSCILAVVLLHETLTIKQCIAVLFSLLSIFLATT
jgi:transporter family protein